MKTKTDKLGVVVALRKEIDLLNLTIENFEFQEYIYYCNQTEKKNKRSNAVDRFFAGLVIGTFLGGMIFVVGEYLKS